MVLNIVSINGFLMRSPFENLNAYFIVFFGLHCNILLYDVYRRKYISMHISTVLIVDDSSANTTMLAEILGQHGYQTLVAESAKAVFELLNQGRIPDLILLDVMMPDMDGFELCRRLKIDSRTEDIPIIFMSALNETKDIVEGFEAGAVDYIEKPFKIVEALARVKTHINTRIQQQQLQAHYNEIERLQRVLRKFLSQSAWRSIEADLGINQAAAPELRYETATIMFTDVAAFTSISEALEPEQLMADLIVYMNTLSWVVHKHKGEIDKFLGDGLFAFFEDASEALEAATEIQQELFKFNDMQRQAKREVFLTRIGLATGRILQTTLGFGDRLEHTIIGDRVNTASRLQAKASIGGILMDEATFLAAGSPENTIQDAIELKGKAKLESTYAMLSEAIETIPS
jgi:adenylate cyclase